MTMNNLEGMNRERPNYYSINDVLGLPDGTITNETTTKVFENMMEIMSIGPKVARQKYPEYFVGRETLAPQHVLAIIMAKMKPATPQEGMFIGYTAMQVTMEVINNPAIIMGATLKNSDPEDALKLLEDGLLGSVMGKQEADSQCDCPRCTALRSDLGDDEVDGKLHTT